MPALTDMDRILLRTALKAARRNDVPSVGMRTETLERLLAHLAELEKTRPAPSGGEDGASG